MIVFGLEDNIYIQVNSSDSTREYISWSQTGDEVACFWDLEFYPR